MPHVPCTGQLALPLEAGEPVPRRPRPRPVRARPEHPELDLGPLVRRKKPTAGPRWPPFGVDRWNADDEPDGAP